MTAVCTAINNLTNPVHVMSCVDHDTQLVGKNQRNQLEELCSNFADYSAENTSIIDLSEAGQWKRIH